VEEVRSAHSGDLPKPHSHVLVIARGQQPAALSVKCIDRTAVLLRRACSSIDPQEPQLVEARAADLRQHWIIAASIRLEVPGYDVSNSAQFISQQRKTSDVPIILGVGDAALKKNSD
jgi:hypothetical protein